MSSTLVSGGVVYATALDYADGRDYLYALDAGTGRLLWRYRSRQLFSGAYVSAVAGGMAYIDYDAFADGGYGVAALGARTGKVLWTHETSRISSTSAIVSGGVVYALGELDPADGPSTALYALRASDGKVLWTYQDWLYHYPLTLPTLVGEVAYVFGSSTLSAAQTQFDVSTLYALNASDGTLVWDRQWPLLRYAGGSVALAVANGVIYTKPQQDHQGAENVYAVRASDGAILWQTHIAGGVDDPVVLDGTIYLNANAFARDRVGAIGLYALDARTGKPRVLFRGYIPHLLAAGNGALYVQGQDAKDPYSYALYAVDASSGAIRWYFHPERMLPAQGLLTVWGPINGVFYATVSEGSGENALYALDAGTGKALWRAAIDVNGVAQTASNGRVFIASGSYHPNPCTPPKGVGYVYALDAGTGAVIWRYQIGTRAG